MRERTDFEILMIRTNNIALLWKDVHGIAPDNAALKMDVAMLDWQCELTNTLKTWIDKGLNMSIGELILARANLGAVTEAWLRFFYCAYYDDYSNNPMMKSGKILEPEDDMRFIDLIRFSKSILWDDENSDDYKWIDRVRVRRNAIHSFTYKEVGTSQEFLDDVEYLYGFVERLVDRLPPVEDMIDVYPEGYIRDVLYDSTDEMIW